MLLGFITAILNGRVDIAAKAAMDSAKAGVNLGIELMGVVCLWSGLMSIAEKGGLVKAFSRVLNPLIRLLFPDVPKNHKAVGAIVMNIAANFFGLGNAATPFGLKAMTELQKLNREKETATDSMCMFLIINTATIQLIPATVIALRSAAGSKNPTEIMFPIWISSMAAFICGVIICKLLSKVWRC